MIAGEGRLDIKDRQILFYNNQVVQHIKYTISGLIFTLDHFNDNRDKGGGIYTVLTTLQQTYMLHPVTTYTYTTTIRKLISHIIQTLSGYNVCVYHFTFQLHIYQPLKVCHQDQIQMYFLFQNNQECLKQIYLM